MKCIACGKKTSVFPFVDGIPVCPFCQTAQRKD